MDHFENLLAEATARVPDVYFQMPIDGAEDPIYRERVYCYELYHQIRSLWPQDSTYSFCGEVDKSGHPLIRGNGLDNCKPDFLVHRPGDMAGNFLVMEVKPIKTVLTAVRKDISTLGSFLGGARYEKAIYLLYGRFGDGNGLDLVQKMKPAIEQHRIEIWHHPAAGTPANRIL
jgi:hypothetical protein